MTMPKNTATSTLSAQHLEELPIQAQAIDHLGLIASTIKKLGTIEKIDQRIPIAKEKGAKLSMGQRVAAMILNGLGFVDDPHNGPILTSSS